MNREIKFRAWSTEPGFVCKGMTYDFHKSDVWPAVMQDASDWSHVTVMQYTGLKDKNGKDIYEGDIVQRWGSGSKKETVVETKDVIWDAIEAAFIYRGATFPLGINTGKYGTNCIEVIGNVYENPELLSTEK